MFVDRMRTKSAHTHRQCNKQLTFENGARWLNADCIDTEQHIDGNNMRFHQRLDWLSGQVKHHTIHIGHWFCTHINTFLNIDCRVGSVWYFSYAVCQAPNEHSFFFVCLLINEPGNRCYVCLGILCFQLAANLSEKCANRDHILFMLDTDGSLRIAPSSFGGKSCVCVCVHRRDLHLQQSEIEEPCNVMFS